ncbi:galectin [Elysia marginata]|uniref:Galectin n=1 Tax=Elysia marginata TaxID=1093978 RepID=A0AAV4JEW1_9GAST|nr:galectin [Elysia marginata]
MTDEDDLHRFKIILSEKIAHKSGAIPFCMDLSFDMDTIVLNTFRTPHEWGQEVRVDGLPILSNQWYEIQIVVTYDGYKVFINGNYIQRLAHRLPKSAAKYLIVSGNTRVLNIENKEGPQSFISF